MELLGSPVGHSSHTMFQICHSLVEEVLELGTKDTRREMMSDSLVTNMK